MTLALITLLTAIAISGIAAYFSIVGLVAIFSATPISIAIMGCSLEVAKLVTASWVYRNWNTAPATIKYYFTVAVIILSLLTSMGIFGYLSKSHIQQSTILGANGVELDILTQQENILKSRISVIISQNDKTTYASTRLSRELEQAQNQLKDIITKKAPLLQEKNQLEAEVGPLKYITEFIYGKSDTDLLNKSVRWVIILLIFVFDPLAILLLIGANISFNQHQKILPVTSHNADDLFTSDVKISKNRIHEISKEFFDKKYKK